MGKVSIYLIRTLNNKTRSVKCLMDSCNLNFSMAKDIVDKLPHPIKLDSNLLDKIKKEFEIYDLSPTNRIYHVEIDKNCICPECNKPLFSCFHKRDEIYITCYSVGEVIKTINELINKQYDEEYIRITTNDYPVGFGPILPVGIHSTMGTPEE